LQATFSEQLPAAQGQAAPGPPALTAGISTVRKILPTHRKKLPSSRFAKHKNIKAPSGGCMVEIRYWKSVPILGIPFALKNSVKNFFIFSLAFPGG